MIESATKKTSVTSRRQEIERRLADFGLTRGPRRLFRGEKTADFEEPRSLRLRGALEGLGPIFCSFGRYMSSRVDLWPVQDCLDLATIRDRARATPASAIRELLTREIDGSPEDTFMRFEEEPFESRLLFQSHHAQLNNGAEVIVKIIHPEVEDSLLNDVDLLSLLGDSFTGPALSGSAFKSAVADFCHALHQQLDFVHEARAFEVLAQDAEEYEALRTPLVYRSLCTSKVFVIEKLDGLRLDSLLPSQGGAGCDADSRTLLRSVGFERNELARLLCEVWLIQTLRGRCFPVEPHPQNILVLPGKQIAFTDGAFASFPTEPQANLWDYLIAAANEDSDRACSCLLEEMRRGVASVKVDDVRRRFRQAMPFRDGGWSARSDNQSFAELLFVHWRFASECGYLPLMHLPAFYRGLFSLADTARRLAPEADPVTEGLRDARLIAGLDGFRELMGQRQFADQMDRYAAMLTDMPQSLDGALTLASEGRARFNSQVADAAGQRVKGNSSAVVAALLLVLFAFVLLSRYITATAVAGAWANRIGAAVFVLLGALVLRNVIGGR